MDTLLHRALALLSYEPETGVFRYLSKTGARAAGDVAGSRHSEGYVRLKIDGVGYGAHRIAWLMVTGRLPLGQIDHINGVRDDNRMANLRDVPALINCQNRRFASARNKTGVLGVVPAGDKFSAYIGSGYGCSNLGTFDTKEEAGAAYVAAKRVAHEGCTL